MRKTQDNPDRARLIGYGKGDPSELPPFIRELDPMWVEIARKGALIQLDGGGIAGGEGLFVPSVRLGEGAAAYAMSRGLRVLDAERCVLIYQTEYPGWLLDE